jgi:hypothetical protein
VNNDVTNMFLRLEEIYSQQMAVTLDEEETTQRYLDNRLALAVEMWLKGYDIAGWES